MNPGGSVKDRAALAIIEDAEKRGLLKPGGVIVEGTAGNTGIGLALVGNARGYRTVIVMPETQSQEKKDMLRLCGADLRLVPAVPYANPDNYVHYLRHGWPRSSPPSEPNGAIWANQFDNTANRDGHYRTTGPEIWEQTERQGRRLHLRGRHRRHAGRRRRVRSRSAIPTSRSRSPTRWARRSTAGTSSGELKAEGNSITEGIGQGRITANLEGAPIDMRLPDPRRGGAARRSST